MNHYNSVLLQIKGTFRLRLRREDRTKRSKTSLQVARLDHRKDNDVASKEGRIDRKRLRGSGATRNVPFNLDPEWQIEIRKKSVEPNL